MKFISVSLIKDEADIIELFIRINSRVIDHFFILDNGSTDDTLRILEKLVKEGFKITLFKDPNPNYQQNLMTTKAFRTAADMTDFDWAFIIDADEFINIPRIELEKELETIPKNQAAALNWSTWIPKGDLWQTCDNPLWSNFQKKKKETEEFKKVIISNCMPKNIVFDMGNHNAYISFADSYNTYDGALLEHNILKCGSLDHVPVRSSKQILLKILTGSIKMSLKKDRQKFESYHWDNNCNMIRKNNFEVDHILLRYLALNYSGKPDVDPLDEVDEELKLGLETDKIKYNGFSKINERSRFFNFMISVTEPMRSLK